MLPKEIPCPNCQSPTRVIIRTAAGGKIYYIGVHCYHCDAYVQAAAHSDQSEKIAGENGLKELRRQWKYAKDEIDQIKLDNPKIKDDPVKVAKIYRENRGIKRR
jgi:hypothetical protein